MLLKSDNKIRPPFFQIPAFLFLDERFATLKPGDRELYALLFSRFSLTQYSVGKGNRRFVDEAGCLFAEYSLPNLCKMLGASRNTVRAALRRLQACGLIIIANTKRSGHANAVYLCYVAGNYGDVSHPYFSGKSDEDELSFHPINLDEGLKFEDGSVPQDKQADDFENEDACDYEEFLDNDEDGACDAVVDCAPSRNNNFDYDRWMSETDPSYVPF